MVSPSSENNFVKQDRAEHAELRKHSSTASTVRGCLCIHSMRNRRKTARRHSPLETGWDRENELLEVMANKLLRTCAAKNTGKRTCQSHEINVLDDFGLGACCIPCYLKAREKKKSVVSRTTKTRRSFWQCDGAGDSNIVVQGPSWTMVPGSTFSLYFSSVRS